MELERLILYATLAVVVIGVPLWMRRASERRVEEAAIREMKRRRRTARASATIKGAERTGMSINDQPQVRIKLSMDLPEGPAEMELLKIVDILHLHRIEVGRTLEIRYEPTDRSNLVSELDDDFEA